MDFSKIKINCCDLPSLMSNGRENKPLSEKQKEDFSKMQVLVENKIPLSKTAQAKYDKHLQRIEAEKERFVVCKANESTLRKIYSREKYGKCIQNISKDYMPQMMNGTLSEGESLKLASEVLSIKLRTSKKVVTNEFLKGIMDAYTGRSINKAKHVVDIKTAANYETFLDMLDITQEKTKYYWQVMGYLSITGAKSGSIIHTCVSYHPDIITQEINKYLLRIRGLNIPKEKVDYRIEKIRNNLTFDNIPKNERIIKITIDRNDDDIQLIHDKVIVFRKFLQEFDEKCRSMNK